MLTIITPVFCSSKNDYLYERTNFFIERSFTSDSIKRIIVDFGSPDFIQNEFSKLAKKNNIEFFSLNMKNEPFSSGICRNHGVMRAKTEFITFQDVDLYAPDSAYYAILNRLNNVTEFNYLETVPCLYISEKYTTDYQSSDNWEKFHQETYLKHQEKDSDILMYAPVTSMTLCRRAYFMECGGNSEEFHGHGYEDFEVLNRLANRSNKFVRSRDYYSHDYKYDSPHFGGYRTFFTLFGRTLMNEGLFFVHFWHPSNPVPAYTKRNKDNRVIFDRLIRKFDKENYMPSALSGYSHNFSGKTLILAPHNGKTTRSLRTAIPYMGECVYARDMEFSSVENFGRFVTKNKVSRVLFFNSFGNDHRLKLFNYCKERNIGTINFDRGGLPDTWFFDCNGFNYSSSSYASEKWNKPLSDKQSIETQEYIREVLTSDETLEKNGCRIGAINFRNKYNLVNKKVLFIPMQRPGDSVIKHFSDKIGSVERFYEGVVSLAKKLKPLGWTVIVKQHPLEENRPVIEAENITILKPSDHFYDAIGVSDATMLINSGVGLYSLMQGKPTFNIGNAYYSHEGLSVKLDHPEKFADIVENIVTPSSEKVIKFIHYLRNEFYSYGKTIYNETIDPKTKEKTSNAVLVEFERISLPLDNGNMMTIVINRRSEPFKITSTYFDFYRSGIILREEIEKKDAEIKKLQDQLKQKNTVPKTSPIAVKLSPPAVVPHGDNKDAKIQKLKRKPILFFRDAFKNIYRSSNRKGDRA
jgi:predicted glycosyltransferase involved in capsule biosynthesis